MDCRRFTHLVLKGMSKKLIISIIFIISFSLYTIKATAATVTFQQGANGYAGFVDRTIGGSSNAAYSATPSPASIYLRNGSISDFNSRSSYLIWFDVSSIPSGSTITSAKLTLKSGYVYTSSVVHVRQVLDPNQLGNSFPQGWSTSGTAGSNAFRVGANAAYRNQTGTSNGIKWTINDTSSENIVNIDNALGAEESGSAIFWTGNNIFYDHTITQAIQGWVNGSPNQGLLVYADATANLQEGGSVQSSLIADRPMVTVIYSTTPPPTGDSTAPSVPAGLTATAISSSQINLNWTASTDNIGVTGYDIYRGGTPLATVIGTSYLNTGLTASTLYSYTVRAKDAAGNNSAQTTPVSATTQAVAPTSPPTITISASPTSITIGNSSTLTWSGTNATSCTASGAWSGTKATSGTQTLTNLTTMGTYTLTCIGAGGTATQSATVSVGITTPPSSGNSAGFEGFGANVTGGMGGTVVTVTNLNDSGPGSFREAVNGSNRIVQFAVAGTINLNSPIRVNGPNVTIDGFSASSPGITITSGSNALVIPGNSSWPDTTGSNIIIEGLRFRNVTEDAIQIAYNAHDIVVDHNSFSGSGDGEVDATEGAYNVTISNNILSKNRGPGASLLATGASRVSYHHNIFYGNNSRNPKMDASFGRNYSSGPNFTGPIADVRYNIIWDYQIGTYLFSSGGTVNQSNVVSNLYKSSGVSNPSNVIVRDSYDSTPNGEAYIQGNISIPDCRGSAYSEFHGSYPYPSTNSMNNHIEFSSPAITGPAVSDQQGRLNEWLAVRNSAGVVAKFSDDLVDTEVRSQVVIPAISVFSQPWNSDATPSVTITITPPPTCTTFTYSAWGTCQSNNTQSRTTTTSSPQSCTGGVPVLTQSCTYTPPTTPTQTTCTIFTYSSWNTCQSNNTQSRTTTSTSPQGCTGGTPLLTQSCTYTPAPPPSSSGGGGTSSGGGSSTTSGTTSSGGGTTSSGTTGGTTTGGGGGVSTGSITTTTGGTSPTTNTTTTTGTTTMLPEVKGPFGIGTSGDEVKKLQTMLKYDGVFSGDVTGYYGPLTQKAVETFQTKYNLVTSGTPGTTGFGLAGPDTRAKLNQLYGGPPAAAGTAQAGGGGTTTDREALLASLRKQVEELIKILQGLIAKLAALKAGQGVAQ